MLFDIKIKTLFERVHKVLLYSLFGVGLLVIYLLFLSPHHRLYQVIAESEYVKLMLADSLQNHWNLSDFEICEPKEVEFTFGDETVAKEPMPLDCLAPKYVRERWLQLNPNTTASLYWSMKQGLQITLSADESVGVLQPQSTEQLKLGNTVLLHRKTDNSASLLLTFEGEMQIGAAVKPGQEGLLRGGLVQVFEKVKFLGKRYLLGEIELNTGDAITFVQQQNEETHSIVKGFLRVSAEETGFEKGIYITAYTTALNEAQQNSLQVSRFGTEGYIFSPTIWNRIQADPWTSLCITIFGVLLIMLELITKWKERQND